MNNSLLLVFDLGRVFVDFDYRDSIKRLAIRCGLFEEYIYKELIGSGLFTGYECGLLTTEEFFKTAKTIINFNGSFEEFASCFTDVFRPIQPMIELHRKCKNSGYKTYLLSNTNEITINYFKTHFPFINEFDGWIFSYQHRAMKPDEKIYRILENHSGYCGEKIVYIDDVLENVQAAQTIGWRAFLHENPEKTTALFYKLGILRE